MKKCFGKLLWITGVLLNVLTVFCAFIYLFGVVVWIHAPAVHALLLTLAMALPFFGLAWFLRRLGRSSFAASSKES